MKETKTIHEKIESAAELFDFENRYEIHIDDIMTFIGLRNCTVSESGWKDEDGGWPGCDREGRTIIVLTPTAETGLLQPLDEWVIVIG